MDSSFLFLLGGGGGGGGGGARAEEVRHASQNADSLADSVYAQLFS